MKATALPGGDVQGRGKSVGRGRRVVELGVETVGTGTVGVETVGTGTVGVEIVGRVKVGIEIVGSVKVNRRVVPVTVGSVVGSVTVGAVVGSVVGSVVGAVVGSVVAGRVTGDEVAGRVVEPSPEVNSAGPEDRWPSADGPAGGSASPVRIDVDVDELTLMVGPGGLDGRAANATKPTRLTTTTLNTAISECR